MSENSVTQNVPINQENEIIIESNLEIDENDYDLIVMFFESKKQSGGGDTLNHELLANKKLIKLVFEEKDAKERILKKKFLTFKNYLFKSFESNINGYKFENYELNKNILIIRNILIESDVDIKDPDHSVVRMYAEHLAPDNDIIEIHHSSLFINTFYVTYKENLDNEQLKSRYQKKPKLRNKEINLLKSFETNSFLISSTTESTQKSDFHHIKLKIIEEIEKRETKSPINYFTDENDIYILFQFDDSSIINELIDSMKVYLKSQDKGMTLEYCHNFELLAFFIEKPKTTNKKTIDNISTQTDKISTKEENVTLTVSKKDVISKLEKKFPETVKGKSPIEQDKSTKIKTEAKSEKNKVKTETKKDTKPTKDANCEDLRIESIKMDNIYLGNLIKSETDNEISLNEEAPLSIGLKNCSQLRIDLDKALKSLNAQLSYNKKNKFKSLSIKFDKDLKTTAINILKNFAKINFVYKIVHLPCKILTDTNLMDPLRSFIPKLNKQYPAVYLELKNNQIHSYGYPKSLDKVLEKNCAALKEIISTKTDAQKLNQFHKSEEKNLAEKQVQKEEIKNVKKEIKKNQTMTMNQHNKTQKNKQFENLNLDSNLIILFNSCEPNNEIMTEKNQLLNNPNTILIDEKHFKLLSVCLSKCSQIALDFINDLKLISPKLELVKIEDQTQNQTIYAISMNSSNEEILNQTSQENINKLMDYYEKNRLKYVNIIIDEKLRIDKVFEELVSKFNSKDELNDLRIILEMIYQTDKVVHAQLVDKSVIEIYGYTNAVQNYDNYVYEILNKTINKMNNNLNNMLAFKLFLKENPKLAVFFRFDGVYFNDFAMQSSCYNAYCAKLLDQKAIHIACMNKKLKNNPRKLDKIEDVQNWRKNIDGFIEEYLSNFSVESIKMPFSRNSEKCKNIFYDKNTLDISWIGDEQIEIIGLGDEIEKFKQNISN